MFTLWPISFWQGKCSPQSQSLAPPGRVPPEFTRRCKTRRAAVSSLDLHLSPLLQACSSPLELATPRGNSKPMREASPRPHTPIAPLSCCSREASRLLSGSHWVWTSVVHGGNLPLSWHVCLLSLTRVSWDHLPNKPPLPLISSQGLLGVPQTKTSTVRISQIPAYQRGHQLVPKGILLCVIFLTKFTWFCKSYYINLDFWLRLRHCCIYSHGTSSRPTKTTSLVFSGLGSLLISPCYQRRHLEEHWEESTKIRLNLRMSHIDKLWQ